MEFSVTGRHFEITDVMRQYAEAKAGKLARFYDRVETIEVILEQQLPLRRVEVVVRADHRHTFVAHVDAGDFYEAIDLVVDKLGRQLNRHKERVRNRKHPSKASRTSEEDIPTEGGT